MQFDLFNAPKTEISKIKLEELFEAYFACRSNKRSTINAIAFEVDYPLSEMSLFMNKFLVCAARMSLTSRRFK